MGQAAELLPVKLSYSLPISNKELYAYVSKPVFLEEWFAEEVDIEEEGREIIYIFKKDGQEFRAKLVEKVPNKLIKFRWIDHPQKRGQNLIFQVMPSKTEENTTNLFIYDSCNQLKIKLLEKRWRQEIDKLIEAI